MPKGVVEKQPNRAAVWTFQEAEAVGGSEVDSFNSKVNGKVNTLQQQGRKSVHYVVKQIHFLHHTSGLYLPNAEMTLDLEANEVEVKVLTSLASVTEITGDGREIRWADADQISILGAKAFSNKARSIARRWPKPQRSRCSMRLAHRFCQRS